MEKSKILALCGTLIILGFTGIMLISNPQPPQPEPTPPEPTPPESPRIILRIIVRDLNSQIPISDVEVEIQTTQEIIIERTTHDGTLVYEIPTQDLKLVYISLRKEGYQAIRRKPISQLIHPNQVRTFYLEPNKNFK